MGHVQRSQDNIRCLLPCLKHMSVCLLLIPAPDARIPGPWTSGILSLTPISGVLGSQTCAIHPAFTWMLRMQTQILMGAWQVLLLTGPSPLPENLLCFSPAPWTFSV